MGKHLPIAHLAQAQLLPCRRPRASEQQEVAAAPSDAATHLRACLAAASRWQGGDKPPAAVPELLLASFLPQLSPLSAAIRARAELELAVAPAPLPLT